MIDDINSCTITALVVLLSYAVMLATEIFILHINKIMQSIKKLKCYAVLFLHEAI